MAEEESEERRVSKYNAAVAQLMRLDALWKKAHLFAMAGLVMKWLWVLDRVWVELCADADDKEKAEFKEKRAGIKKIQDKPLGKKLKKDELYDKLTEVEIFLRVCQNAQRKGTAYFDDSGEGAD